MEDLIPKDHQEDDIAYGDTSWKIYLGIVEKLLITEFID